MTINDTIVLATRNQGKIRELSKMLADFNLTVVGLEEFPSIGEIEETGSTFEANALLKARYVSRESGLVAVADDSGIIVDALDGAPGVYSARFSAEDGVEATDERNNAKLLAQLSGLPSEKRSARFCSVVAAVAPGGEYICAEGLWEGFITTAPKGENGFGYDPLFLDPELGMTAGEMGLYEKNQRSHRARAVAKLAEGWPAFWNSLPFNKA